MSAFGGKAVHWQSRVRHEDFDDSRNRSLFFSWAFNLVVDDLSRFDESLFGSGERRRRCQLEPVFIVDRHNEAGLAREIETVEMVSLGLEDHSLGSRRQ